MSDTAPDSSTHFRVRVLGPFALTRDGEQIDTDHWQRRAASVFKLLVTVPEHRRLRDEVIDLLWPDAAPDAGMRNLRIVLHRLRQALGGGEPSPVLLERGWVSLNPSYDWDIDLDRFETLTSGANGDPAPLLQAAGLYGGEALPEDRYDDWAVPVRERVQRTWRTLCLRLAEAYLARATYEEAARWFERVLAEDPLDEEALRGLMTALELAGRRADALRRYADFEALLHEQIGAAPSTDTMALAGRLRSDRGAEPPAGGPRPWPVGHFLGALPAGPIVGRREELERLGRIVDEVEGGSGRLILIGGEAGIGKTRLAQQLSVMLRDRGFLVATGRTYRRDRPVPFSPFLDALTAVYGEAAPALRAQVAQRWPELGRMLLGQALSAPIAEIDESEEQRVARGITDFLALLAAPSPDAPARPVAILLDDLQWADDASIALLHHLAARTRAQPVLLAGVYRDLEVEREGALARAIRDLGREGLVERIILGRLTAEETTELVRVTMGSPESEDDGSFEDFVFRRTKGIPYYVERMLNALGGRYRLTHQIGAGGMGRVFEAIDLRTGARVAAKLMFARTEADPRALRRFQQEGEVLATLSHPNIVRVFGTYLDEHSSAIVMERLEGRSLGQVMDAESLPLPRVRRIAEQVAAALASAHERGVIHRDIKPDNIMVLEGDRVKVTDFGIARIARPPGANTTLTSTGVTMGTPLYMAPEQIGGGTVDARTDIYSLGAVLYRAVTGRAPFAADDPLTLAYKHVNEAPIPPREICPALPEDWNALILRALAKDPAERFPGAAAMEDAIRDLASGRASGGVPGEPTAATAAELPAPALPEPVPPRARPVLTEEKRHPILAGLLAIGTTLVALVILIVLVQLFSGHSSNAPKATPTTPAVSLIWGSQGSGPGQFNGPSGAGIGLRDTVWIADLGNHRIEEFSSAGKFLRQWGTEGIGPGQFSAPTDVAVGHKGIIYVADPSGIQELSRSFQPLDTLQFFHPRTNQYSDLTSVAVDGAGNVYATDYSSSAVRKFGADGRLLRSWGQKGAAPGLLNSPDGIAVDPRGFVYVADKFNDRVQRFSLDGKYLGMWGKPGSGPGDFNQPADVAVDGAGNVYVADTFNHRVQEFTGIGAFVAQWGTSGSGYLQFNKPSGLAVDSHGNIYITDYYSNHVEKIVPGRKR